MTKPSKEELSRLVTVQADFQAKWDGTEYDLRKGVELPYGVVHHWQNLYPTVEFRIEDVKNPPIPPRDIVNPLGEEGRGAAFQGLKRGRKPKEAV